ncbi:MAG: photosynthetic complex putative assembly protein PuhB, partial [Pseudomonadota bacterium]
EDAAAAVITWNLAVSVAGATLCVALLAGLAWGYSRSTIYTITSKRLFMRHGIALPMSINIPFSKIVAARMVKHSDGTGTLVLRTNEESRLAWLALWPSVRPRSITSPEPALRCIAKPSKVASLISTAMTAAEGDRIQLAQVSSSTLPAGNKPRKQDGPGLHDAATA